VRTRWLTIGLLSGALFAAGTPAMGGSRSAASKLSLAGAQAAGQGDCVTRAGLNGTWRVNPAGNWVPCNNPGTGKAGAPGQAWLIVGAVGALGIGLGLGLSNKGPSSP
jgi:hypothetical protein